MIYWLSVLAGMVIVAAGIWAKSLLNDADMTISEEEKSNPTPTIAGRLPAVGLGIGMVVFGIVHLLHH